jgi:hypothetical protein
MGDLEANSQHMSAANPTWVANVLFAPKVSPALSTQPPVDADNAEQEDHDSDSDLGVDSSTDDDSDGAHEVSASGDAQALVMTLAGDTLLSAAESRSAPRGSQSQLPAPLSARDAPHPYVLLGQH